MLVATKSYRISDAKLSMWVATVEGHTESVMQSCIGCSSARSYRISDAGVYVVGFSSSNTDSVRACENGFARQGIHKHIF